MNLEAKEIMKRNLKLTKLKTGTNKGCISRWVPSRLAS
jgi:hypothetical protein